MLTISFMVKFTLNMVGFNLLWMATFTLNRLVQRTHMILTYLPNIQFAICIDNLAKSLTINCGFVISFNFRLL